MLATNVFMASGGTSLWETIVSWYQNSVFAELLNYLSERYFTVEFGNYENFSVSSNAGVAARNLVLALALGFIIAAVITAYTREVLGGFVRKMLKDECFSPARAKTLYDLGYFRSSSIRSALKRGSALRMVVRCCDAEEREAAVNAPIVEGERREPEAQNRLLSEKVDFTKDYFYIPEDLRIRAQVRFDNKGSGWMPVLVMIGITAVVAALICWFLPDIVQFADNLITVFAPK